MCITQPPAEQEEQQGMKLLALEVGGGDSSTKIMHAPVCMAREQTCSPQRTVSHGHIIDVEQVYFMKLEEWLKQDTAAVAHRSRHLAM